MQADEQLGLLTRNQHDWGMVWSDFLQPQGLLKGNPHVSEELTQIVEQGLANSIYFKIDDKQGIVENYVELSQVQVEQLANMLIEEWFKLALLAPMHQTQLGEWAKQNREEWLTLQLQPEILFYNQIETSVSRNSPCPCGSGKKYKHCCGKLQ